jgi:uncharacterized protein (UPF0332 family)
VTQDNQQEIIANTERAKQSLAAAKALIINGYYDFAASRAYYAAFYGATAVLLNEGLDFSKHSGVIASIHQRFVKTGKLSKELGKNLNWLFEIRALGDYGGIAHVSELQAEQAIVAAEQFLNAVLILLATFKDT